MRTFVLWAFRFYLVAAYLLFMPFVIVRAMAFAMRATGVMP